MTTLPTPWFVTRPRSADEIAHVLGELLNRATFETAGADPLREAIVRIAARYGEIVTASLNAAPEPLWKGLEAAGARPAESV